MKKNLITECTKCKYPIRIQLDIPDLNHVKYSSKHRYTCSNCFHEFDSTLDELLSSTIKLEYGAEIKPMSYEQFDIKVDYRMFNFYLNRLSGTLGHTHNMIKNISKNDKDLNEKINHIEFLMSEINSSFENLKNSYKNK